MGFDIITIGSATIDVFISSKSKQIDVERIHGHEDVCLPIGAKILINNLYVSTGGGAHNAAFCFSRLGLKTGWVGLIGKGHNGKIIKELTKKEKISFLGKEKPGESGYSVILIGFNKNRTILTYKGINNDLEYKDVKKPLKAKWFYSSSMMGKSWATLLKILKNKKQTKFAFNPSTYFCMKGIKHLMPALKYCDLLILNKEEAQFLLKSKADIPKLIKKLQKIIPVVVITNGPKGAYSYNGIEMLKLIPKKTKIIETTGAGDSFASAFLAGIIQKKDLKTCLQWGHAQACSIISEIGAKDKLLNKNQLQRILSQKSRVVKV